MDRSPFLGDFLASKFHLTTRNLLSTVFSGDIEKPVKVSAALKVQAPPLQPVTVWSLSSSLASPGDSPCVRSLHSAFFFFFLISLSSQTLACKDEGTRNTWHVTDALLPYPLSCPPRSFTSWGDLGTRVSLARGDALLPPSGSSENVCGFGILHFLPHALIPLF